MFVNVQLSELINKGIYHSKTFLILNKILQFTKSDYELINFPLNLFIWFLIILIITFFISKKIKRLDFYIFSILYIIFICFYFFTLIVWAEHNNLINENFTLEISWERHLGTLILGIIIFLIVNLFKLYKKNFIPILIFVFIFNIAPANSIKIFLPSKIVLKEKYWSDKYNQRLSIKNLSNEINQEIEDYANLIIYFKNIKDPYFVPILKYELINVNTIDINADNSIHFFDNFKFEKKLYVMTDIILNDKKTKNLFNTNSLFLKSNLTFKKLKTIKDFNFYEISYSNIR